MLRAHGREIIAAAGTNLELVELGPGNGEKLPLLLKHCPNCRVHLIDVSATALESARRRLQEAFDVEISLCEAQFAEGLASLPHRHANAWCFFWARISGTLHLSEATDFLRVVHRSLSAGDMLLVGVDLVKSEQQLLAAYDDPLGVTAAFNKNILLRINRELGANFDLLAFDHRALWNAAASRIEMHLLSLFDQTVHIAPSSLTCHSLPGKRFGPKAPTNTPRQVFATSFKRRLPACRPVAGGGAIVPRGTRRGMIKFRGVSKRFGDGAPALANIDLEIPARQTSVLIGPSGCGKSTLLRLIIGLLEPTSGVVEVAGHQVSRAGILELRRRVGYVIQDGGLFPHLTARENITLMAQHLHSPADQINTRLAELCELTRFASQNLDRYPVELSGGQRQRVSLMRALMLKPELLLLDEPLGALDPLVRARLQQDLKEIFAQLAQTIVLVTHDMAEAAFLGDTLVLMNEGRIAQEGRLEDLRKRPASPFVSEFMNAQRGLAGL